MGHDGSSDFEADLRTTIEAGVKAQLSRHHRIDSTIDPHAVVDIAIGQAKEKLERLAEKWDEEGSPEAGDTARVIAKDWLPGLASDLKRQY